MRPILELILDSFVFSPPSAFLERKTIFCGLRDVCCGIFGGRGTIECSEVWIWILVRFGP